MDYSINIFLVDSALDLSSAVELQCGSYCSTRTASAGHQCLSCLCENGASLFRTQSYIWSTMMILDAIMVDGYWGLCSLEQFSDLIEKYLEGRGHVSVLTENVLSCEQCLTTRCKIVEVDEKRKCALEKHSDVSLWESYWKYCKSDFYLNFFKKSYLKFWLFIPD